MENNNSEVTNEELARANKQPDRPESLFSDKHKQRIEKLEGQVKELRDASR